MNEYDWDSELNIHRNRKLQAAEQWRWAKAARPASVWAGSGRLLELAAVTASRASVAPLQVVQAASPPSHHWHRPGLSQGSSHR